MAGADPPSFFCKCFSYWSYFGKRYHDNHLRAQSEASYTHNITQLLRNLTQNVCIGIATLLMTPLATGFLGSCDGNVALGQNFKDPHLPPQKGWHFPFELSQHQGVQGLCLFLFGVFNVLTMIYVIVQSPVVLVAWFPSV